MEKELENKLIDKFPTYFRDMYGDPRKTCMSFGVDFGAGWYEILHDLCNNIKAIEKEDTNFYFLQLKEKFGILRAYASYKDDTGKIAKLIDEAERKSARVCELCGSKEKVTTEGRPSWISTWCEKCAEETELKMIKYVNKGWGYEKIIVNKPAYCGKLLHFINGKKCSYHYHIVKEETFYLQSGKLRLLVGQDDDITKATEVILNPGDKYHIPTGLRHQMIALEDSDLFEFSTQDFPEDSIRVVLGD